MDINSHLPSHSNPLPFNQLSQNVNFDRLLASQPLSPNLPFLAGILSLDSLKKIERGEANHIEIRFTQDISEFVEAIKNRTAVVVQTSQDQAPVFKFSKEVNRLIDDQNVNEFKVFIGDQTKGYNRHSVQTDKYSFEDMRALDSHFLEELEEFFRSIAPISKESDNEQQRSIDQNYRASQKRLEQMRNQARLRQEEKDEQPEEVKKEKAPPPEKVVGEGTLFAEIVDKQERASKEVQEQKEQDAKIESKREAKATNLWNDGDPFSLKRRKMG